MPETSKNREPLGEIFEIVAQQTGCDLSTYKQSTLSRRLDQRIRRLGLPNVGSYATWTREHPEEAILLLHHVLIGVTSFFRNPPVYQAFLAQLSYPAHSSGLRVWSAGCSTGEEAYGLAMVLREYLDRTDPTIPLQVFATDLSPKAIEKARTGWYTANAVASITPAQRDRWLEFENSGWRIRKELRSQVTFAVHNLVVDPPFRNLDAVFCRNVFIYLTPEAKRVVERALTFSLKTDGLLVLGTSETLAAERLFELCDKRHKIFRRRPVVPQSTSWPAKPTLATAVSPPHDDPLRDAVLDVIAQDYADPTALVDSEGHILYVTGDTRPFFRRHSGRASNQILSNVEPAIQAQLARLLDQASLQKHEVQAPDKSVVVRPLNLPGLPLGARLVVFRRHLDKTKSNSEVPLTAGSPLAEMEQELADNRLYLNSLIRKLEASNEELGAANEEYQAINEELQSANDELQSSREELQITNDDLERSNNDLANLVNSARVALVFLDREGRIQRVTPEARRLLDLSDADRGSVFSLKARAWWGRQFTWQGAEVLATEEASEAEVRHGDSVLQVRTLPYRTELGTIEGLAVVLTDVTMLRQAQRDNIVHERQFHSLFEFHPGGLLLGEIAPSNTGSDLTILAINRTLNSWLGHGHPSVEGQALDRLRDWGLPLPTDWIVRALGSQDPVAYHVELGLGTRALRLSIFRLGDRRFVLTLDDVSEAVRREQALRTSENLFRTTLTSMDDFVTTLDADGRFATFFQSHRQQDLYLGPEEFLGKTPRQLGLPQEAKDQLAQAFDSIKAGSPVASWTYSLPYSDGERWFSARMTPLIGAEGIFQGAVQVSRDITDLMETERALADREAQLRAVFEASPLGMYLSQNGVVLRANQALRQMFGVSPLEGIQLDQLVLRGTPIQGIRAGSGPFPLRIDEAEVEMGLTVGVVQDLTERQRIERTVLNSQRLESLGVLAGGIAHDFNNLLGGLFGFLQLARKATPDDAPSVRHLDRAVGAFGRAQDLTRQLLTFSKGGEPNKKVQPLGPIIEDTFRFVLSGSALTVSIEVAPDLWPCEVDKHQLAQVFDNLGMNARQAVPPGGKVTISAQNWARSDAVPQSLSEGPYVLVRVSDNGPGIAPDVLPRIFDPFFSTRKEGSGLGLATVESIVRKHGGQIEAGNGPDGGAEFCLWFPAQSLSDDRAPSHNNRVLILDDEILILDTLEELLTDMGYHVTAVRTGPEAREAVLQRKREGQRFGLFLTDLTLPGEKGGIELVAQLKQIEPQMTAAASSGYSDDPVVANPGAWGFAGFLAKPYTRDQLANFMTRLLPL